jgi:hypothetical protein
MRKPMKFTFEKPAGAPGHNGHPDYQRNLENAKKFVENTKKSLLNGMDVKVADTHNLKESVLRISWKPPQNCYGSTCSTPINLHQPTSDVNNQIEKIFNVYMKTAKEKLDKANEELEFFPLGLKA